MSSSPLRIAIVGGGPAGLTLGVLLHKRGIPFTIFELRQKPTDEELSKPSGSLDLHDATGIAALRECGLYDEFALLTGDCSESQVIAHKNGKVIYKDEGEHSNRPEISRHKLSNLLLSHLPASAIKWEHKLLSAQSSPPHPEVELDFGENGKHTFDLVVGADGAWSRVRKLLTEEGPNYAGVQNITLNITQLTSKYPHLANFVGSGSFFAFAEGNGVISQRSGDDSTRIYVMFSSPDEGFAAAKGLTGRTPAQAKDRLIVGDDALLRGWGEPLLELVAAACDDDTSRADALDIKPLYQLPIGHNWPHVPGATLIGDAAHLMCPWAGEGVNLAMRDALQLSQAIAQALEAAGSDPVAARRALDPLVQQFETKMVAAAKVTAEETAQNGEMMIGSADGSTVMADFFTRVISQLGGVQS